MMREMLGSVDEVTDKNVMQYLGVVEQKALEMLHIYQYVDMKVKGDVSLKVFTCIYLKMF